jgi:hypothetical protein
MQHLILAGLVALAVALLLLRMFVFAHGHGRRRPGVTGQSSYDGKATILQASFATGGEADGSLAQFADAGNLAERGDHPATLEVQP